MPYRVTRSWRQWFFEVFAPNSRMPFEPPPLTDAERQELQERGRQIPEELTRLHLTEDDSGPHRPG